jgi:hypothetical protein
MADTDDLKPLLTRLLGIVEGTARDVAGLTRDVAVLTRDVADIKGELKTMNVRLDGFEKRLDDQGRILAALVPTRLAAVPPSAAE